MTNDEKSHAKQQLPKMVPRALAEGLKRRKGMSLDLPPDSGQITPDADYI